MSLGLVFLSMLNLTDILRWMGGAIGLSLALMAIFFLPQIFGNSVGYGLVFVYWCCVLGASLIYGIPKYLRLWGSMSDEERSYFWSGSKGAGVLWSVLTFLFTWPIAIGSILWLFGFQDPGSWYVLLLVAASWLWMLSLTLFVR